MSVLSPYLSLPFIQSKGQSKYSTWCQNFYIQYLLITQTICELWYLQPQNVYQYNIQSMLATHTSTDILYHSNQSVSAEKTVLLQSTLKRSQLGIFRRVPGAPFGGHTPLVSASIGSWWLSCIRGRHLSGPGLFVTYNNTGYNYTT